MRTTASRRAIYLAAANVVFALLAAVFVFVALRAGSSVQPAAEEWRTRGHFSGEPDPGTIKRVNMAFQQGLVKLAGDFDEFTSGIAQTRGLLASLLAVALGLNAVVIAVELRKISSGSISPESPKSEEAGSEAENHNSAESTLPARNRFRTLLMFNGILAVGALGLATAMFALGASAKHERVHSSAVADMLAQPGARDTVAGTLRLSESIAEMADALDSAVIDVGRRGTLAGLLGFVVFAVNVVVLLSRWPRDTSGLD